MYMRRFFGPLNFEEAFKYEFLNRFSSLYRWCFIELITQAHGLHPALRLSSTSF